MDSRNQSFGIDENTHDAAVYCLACGGPINDASDGIVVYDADASGNIVPIALHKRGECNEAFDQHDKLPNKTIGGYVKQLAQALNMDGADDLKPE